ncbi:Mariner Mos1 transposase [Eumeta japonica]|uniref:Mariner Mos1 transposase n=1 Tax=Eumeta variegata TaxID=151549 RepID=A0A4C1VZS6_EUMVA|nr:Mariner Mos1 transposase [Eumeta japonica]
MDEIEPSSEGKTPSILLQTLQNYSSIIHQTLRRPTIICCGQWHMLSEQQFTSYDDTKHWVDSWIASKDKEFFRVGIRTLPERWKKVVVSDGQYFD